MKQPVFWKANAINSSEATSVFILFARTLLSDLINLVRILVSAINLTDLGSKHGFRR